MLFFLTWFNFNVSMLAYMITFDITETVELWSHDQRYRSNT
jgi:hypothetical protein